MEMNSVTKGSHSFPYTNWVKKLIFYFEESQNSDIELPPKYNSGTNQPSGDKYECPGQLR